MIYALATWDVARLSESVKTLARGCLLCSVLKVSQHSACKDHAILHGKPFGIPLIFRLLYFIGPVYMEASYPVDRVTRFAGTNKRSVYMEPRVTPHSYDQYTVVT